MIRILHSDGKKKLSHDTSLQARKHSKYLKIFFLGLFLVGVFVLPPLSYADAQTENAKDKIKDIVSGIATKGKSVKGASGSIATILTNADSIICAAWEITFRNTELKLTYRSLRGENVDQQLKKIQELRAMVNKVCGPITSGAEGGESKIKVGGGETDTEQEETEEADTPKVDYPPYHLSKLEKKCWPQCKDEWRAMESARQGALLRATRLSKAQVEADQAALLVKNSRSKLKRAKSERKKAKEIEDDFYPRTSRKIDTARSKTIKDLANAEGENNANEKLLKSKEAALKKAKNELKKWIKIYEKRRAIYLECLKKCKAALNKTSIGMGFNYQQGNTALPASYSPSIFIASDSPEWCSFRDGNPTGTTLDGTDNGDDPRDTPPPDGGNGPRDASSPVAGGGIPTDDGGDPRDAPPTGGGGGDDPRDAGSPVAGGGTTVPGKKEDDDGDDPRDAPVTIYVKAKSSAISVGSTAVATAGQQIKLFAASTTNVALPGKGAAKPQTDHDKEPIQGTTDKQGNLALTATPTAIGAKPAAAGKSYEVSVDTTEQTSLVSTKVAVLPGGLNKYVTDSVNVGGQQYTVLTLPKSQEKTVTGLLDSAGIKYETNYCREKQGAANDPLYKGKGAWKQKYDNQWAIKRVGLTADSNSAWNKLGKNPKPVIVAVIDTGLDWNHLDIDWNNLWRNPKEVPDNGKDDDRNGYVDDLIGWDFYGRHNKPWDHDGHGTVVAGIIAATRNNKVGIAGINPHARIMVLKALNSFGHSRASYLAKAITYAVDNGARIINMSVGGKEITTIEKEAVKYAVSKGVLIVVASGNEGVDVKNYGIAGLDGVLTVSATDLKDKRASFSNWGAQIDIAAPGIDVLSLRARRTDTMRDIPGVEYRNGANYVGRDKRYYRTSGTSFAAPIVTGVASLVMSKHPDLSGEEVAQILMQTADDVDTPGVDQYSGHGIVNAKKALEAEAGMFINAQITGVQVVQGKKGPVVQVMGTAEADQYKKATLHIGAGDNPDDWKKVAKVKKAVKDGLLGEIDANELRSSKIWIIRLTVVHKNGKTQEFRFKLSLG